MKWLDRLRATAVLMTRLHEANDRRDDREVIRLAGLLLARRLSDDDRFRALSLRARARLDSNDPAGSRTDGEAALRLAPQDADIWSNLGIACYMRGDYSDAVQAFAREAAIAPKAEAFTWLAICHHYDGSPAGLAIEAIDQAIALETGDAKIWRWRGLVRRDGDPEGALQDYSRALELEPDRDSHLARAKIFSRLKRPLEAIAEYDLLLHEIPDDVGLLSARGDAKEEAGDLEGALADHVRAHELVPRRLHSGLQTVDLRHKLGRIDEAIEIARHTATSLLPNDPTALHILAHAHRLAGHIDEALTLIDKALGLAFYKGALVYERVVVLMEGHRDEEALDFVEAEVNRYPPSAEFKVLRADLHRRLQHYASAVADYGEVLDSRPDFIAAWIGRAETYLYLGKPEFAHDDALRALALDPENEAARALLHRADAQPG
jgi:tetratricopeptide (TPR) repeat protein